MVTPKTPRVGAAHEADSTDRARAKVWGAMLSLPFFLVGYLVSVKLGLNAWQSFGFVIFFGVASGVFISRMTQRVARAAGDSVLHALQPSGSSTPYQQQYSYQESLAAKGDIAGAIESYEAILVESPGDFEARVRVADLYTRSLKEHARAAEHFRLVQREPSVTPDRHLYASNRLIDLYMGPLDDEGRALVELRKLIDRYDGSAVATQARSALAKLKAARKE